MTAKFLQTNEHHSCIAKLSSKSSGPFLMSIRATKIFILSLLCNLSTKTHKLKYFFSYSSRSAATHYRDATILKWWPVLMKLEAQCSQSYSDEWFLLVHCKATPSPCSFFLFLFFLVALKGRYTWWNKSSKSSSENFLVIKWLE